MESEVDTSILNSVNIKRFTKSVLEEYGAEIDRSNRAKWEVTFPPRLADQLDRQQGTLVFDSADRERGAGELLVQPGTTVFSALLELVQQPGSVGRLQLTEDDLQVNPPDVLRESDLTVDVLEFSGRTSDHALAFHFRVEFETPASFHREEMMTVTVDPETGTRVPALTERLTAHLPQLLEENNGDEPVAVSDRAIELAHEEAQEAVVDRARPIVNELREEADESASERIAEISEWYEQRRAELDEQLDDQREEIRKWKEKRRNARKDSTRRRYIQNRKEAQEELERLKTEVQEKKAELDREESEEIDEVIDRNEVTVDVSLLGVTEVTYVRGRLELELASDHATTRTELSYLPATDDFQGLDCDVCSQDLTEGVLPRLCATGHLVGAPCATTCRTCGITYCESCEDHIDPDHEFGDCGVCMENVCWDCAASCSSCGERICGDHRATCAACDATTCRLCGEPCSTCGAFHCDTHLSWCPVCQEYHCEAHTDTCDICDSTRCVDHLGRCSSCGDAVCSDHRNSCDTCGDALCDRHFTECRLCSAAGDANNRGFCDDDTVRCTVGGEVVCPQHRSQATLGTEAVCDEHLTACTTCDVTYGEHNLDDGQCSACRSLGDLNVAKVPDQVRSDFRSTKAGANSAYMVILGKKLLGRNKVVVYDRRTGEEVHRQSAGTLKQLMGAYN